MVGGATPLLILLLWLLKSIIGFDSAELAVGFLMFHAAHLISDPHFPLLPRLSILVLGSLALGWALFHGLLELLDTALVARHTAHSALGPTPYFAALFTVVNIHHYFIDSVIWRRDNPETRFLVDAAALRQEAR